MFEGILEKLLSSYFGKYLEGLNKEHLSIGVRLNLSIFITLVIGMERGYQFRKFKS
jgi:hypothetical protein